MKFKSGVVIASIAAISIIAIPAIVSAQPHNSMMGEMPNWEGLNLSVKQKSQLQRIGEETRSQMQRVLTPKQRELLKANVSAPGKGNRPQAFSQLNLSNEQKSKIETIRRSSWGKMQAVLTPQQLEKIRQSRRN